jgi:hypothetical protein
VREGQAAHYTASFGFQNCIIRLMRLPLLALFFSSASVMVDGVYSMDSLLLSPCELLMRRDKLPMLDRLRVAVAEGREAERWPSRKGVPCAIGRMVLSLVMVELLLVREGTSSTDILSSGPGSPRRSDWNPPSSVIDDGAVDMRWVS